MKQTLPITKPARRFGLKHWLACALLLAGSNDILAGNVDVPTSMTTTAPFASRQAALAALPPLMLWVWERPDDVRTWLNSNDITAKAAESPAKSIPSLQDQRIGIAVLDTTVMLRDGVANVRRRQQPLQLPAAWYSKTGLQHKAPVVPIVHIDLARGKHKPALNEKQKKTIVGAVLAAAARSPSQVVQLDFEVMHSQKPFLADVVRSTRAALPANVALSITALASWCVGDAWLSDLPADEVVPMAFRMAGDTPHMRNILEEDGRFPRPECQPSLGLSLDEQPWPGKLRSQRLYLFNREAWSATPMASWSVRLGSLLP
ncbi:hypothetical protein [Collimonas arenae]|uniref:hypothetical protein n=1 Tax=Collimonas arenae TaxID=279058 RepID=UPI000A55077F|nr:hypothetical protein [Collimonas arenae]